MHTDGNILRLVLPDIGEASQSEIAAFRREAAAKIKSDDVKQVSFELADGQNWNSLTLAILRSLVRQAKKAGAETDVSKLPDGAVKILALSKDLSLIHI